MTRVLSLFSLFFDEEVAGERERKKREGDSGISIMAYNKISKKYYLLRNYRCFPLFFSLIFCDLRRED